MYLLRDCLFFAVVLYANAETTEELKHVRHIDDASLSLRGHVSGEPVEHTREHASALVPDSVFSLSVHISDALNRGRLQKAAVDVYVNHTRVSAGESGEDGGALLRVPYRPGLPMTVMVSKTGFVPALLPFKTRNLPLYSSISMSMVSMGQGNIWLFEDSVLIAGSTDVSSHPVVRFPKNLLNLTYTVNIPSVRAHLTVTRFMSVREPSLTTLGIIPSQLGYTSVELRPLAAVCVRLSSEDRELHVSRPVQISLRLPDDVGLQVSKTVPAWFLNRTTGGWMRKGLGRVAVVEGKLVWTFAAPHLGYWLAATFPSSRGFFGPAVFVDFISRHSYFLMSLLGGMLLIIICLLLGLLLRCRREMGQSKTRRAPAAIQKNQSTSTCCDATSRLPRNMYLQQEEQRLSPTANQNDDVSKRDASVMANSAAVDANDLVNHRTVSERFSEPDQPTDGLFFYNQPIAIFPPPAFFCLENDDEETRRSKSATLPRASDPVSSKDKDDLATEDVEDDVIATERAQVESRAALKSLFPESASVPGTLHELSQSRNSDRPLVPSPRAWFVSLEGKPAAEIHRHHATAGQQQQRRQRQRRLHQSRESSLDSGVDVSELNPAAAVRRSEAVTLQRKATFVKHTAPK